MSSVASMSFTEARTVVVRSKNHIDINRRRDRGLKQGQGSANAIDGRDDVGARLPEHDDEHGRFAAGEPDVANIFD